MIRQASTTRISAEKGNASRPTQAPTPVRSTPSTRTPPAEASLQRQYRGLTRRHFSRLLDHLFADLTGLRYQIAWAPPAFRDWDTRASPTAGSEYCRVARACHRAEPVCQGCGPKQLARALGTLDDGLAFTCRLGVRNLWLPIRVRDVTIGIACLQALDRPQPGASALPQAARAATRVSSRSDFHRADRLLRLMIEHVQTLDLSELRKAELTQAGQVTIALEKELARLHEALQRHLPAPPQVGRRAKPESRSEQAVRSLLERISKDYAQPITLQQCAAKLGMNAAYVSALFSRAVGRSFKTCLTSMRMDRARELLGDPRQNISDVAAAVGYATANRFRLAFKQATGLAPKSWRETMQMNPPRSRPSRARPTSRNPLPTLWRRPGSAGSRRRHGALPIASGAPRSHV